MTEATTLRDRERVLGRRLGPRVRLLIDVAEFVVGAILGLALIGLIFRGHFLITLVVTLVAVLGGRRLKVAVDRERLRPRLSAGGLVLPVRPAGTFLLVVFSVMAALFLAGSLAVFVQHIRHADPGSALGLVLGLLVGEAIGVLAVVGATAESRQLLIKDRGLVLRPGEVIVNTGRPPVVIPWTGLASADPLVSPSTSSQTLAVLTFYLHHPESRAELGTAAALARVESISRSEG